MALLLVLAMAPLAVAQTDTQTDTQTAPQKHKKKKLAKPAPSASASAAPEDSAPPPEPTAPPAAPAPAPVAPAPVAPAEASLPDIPPGGQESTVTTEDPNKRYYFIGLRYRGTIVPQFLESLFVNEGATIYSNSIGAELDIRKGGQSLIPWIQYTDYNTGDLLFLQKGQDPGNASFYSDVNSGLKAIYLGIDELWSTPIANHLDFEYGFGVGVGVIFGNLQNNWVYQSQNGSLVASNGNHFTACPPTGQPTPGLLNGGATNGCIPGSHTTPNPPKVGGYVEPNWFSGGAVPVFLPHIAVPQLSLRYKPIKQLETRLSIGFSLTGFWFGLSADYGLEHTEEPRTGTSHKSSFGRMVRNTL